MNNQILSKFSFTLQAKFIATMIITVFTVILVAFVIIYVRYIHELHDMFVAETSLMTASLASKTALYTEQGEKEKIDKLLIKPTMNIYSNVNYVIAVKEEKKTTQDYIDRRALPFSILTYEQRGKQNIESIVSRHLADPTRVRELDEIIAITEECQIDSSGKLWYPKLGPLPGNAEDFTTYYICLGRKTTTMAAQQKNLLFNLVTILIIGLALFGSTIYLVIQPVVRRFGTMMNASQRISTGDLTTIISDSNHDEIGVLANSLNQITKNFNSIIRSVFSVDKTNKEIIGQLAESTEHVVQSIEDEISSVEETSSAISQIHATIKGIAENVERLASSAEESSSSILEMAATNDEMVENVGLLTTSVEQTTRSVSEMTEASQEVAKNVDDLSSSAQETSATMKEISASISQVENNTNVTHTLSEQVGKDAEEGVNAVQRTMEGISRISDSTQEAFSILESLGQKVQLIGQVLTVIDDVAEQTNLLALNAAIIAAQAGEHGRGFAVVADEIKDLAERTSSSTSEISNLIQGVQTETQNVIDAMKRGIKDVGEGVGISMEAQQAIHKIIDSSTEATHMVSEIAQATVEQARGAKEVNNSVQRIALSVQEISSVATQQARGTQEMLESANKMRNVTKHVQSSSQEQAHGSKQITHAIENISEMVNNLNQAQQEQMHGTEQIMSAIVHIRDIGEHHTESMNSIKKLVGDISVQSDVLYKEISHFKL